MATDLTGGLSEEREFLFPSRPADPEMRESVNIWAWADGSDVGLPRIGVEAVADQWDTHDIQVNLSFADGRVLNLFGPGKVHDRIADDGRARILGAGPLSFELVEPFRHWRCRLDGHALVTTVQAQIDGWTPGRGSDETVPVELELDIRSAAPPWEVGTLREEAGRVLATQEEGDMMGGPRYEQLFRSTGRLRVGDDERTLRGGGLRIRRSGIRRLATFRGHAWQSAIFPSGRAFGHITYPPRSDGKPTLDEGFVFEGDGALVPARVLEAPWLRAPLQPRGEAVRLVMETERGATTILGETILSTFMVMPPDVGGGLSLQQTVVRYTWDGETANGMLERSTPLARLDG